MLTKDKLQYAANRRSFSANSARSAREAKGRGQATIFLCHSHQDQSLAVGLAQLLQEAGSNVYIDWLDQAMPETPNRDTAARIKLKIIENDYFLFLATENSMRSRWCPWEIGYADGKKPTDSIIVVPVQDGYTNHGQEYLDLYRRIVIADDGHLAIFEPGRTTNGMYARSL
ncbi:toll/interleukin-1 receptor domain-containing protein [Pseudomonas sp. PSB1]|uniref:toll/interleukin-1 receptor domain-containing protein n=1 Tax=Pseudomonas sp. PSB1 TaxID=477819 RepID=UPI0016604571|nr:toll/interleukin-1 receptor domain-containing protein [Pseudomonas sp. PSB1]MBD0704379.1 hypothetical protein [Pseudomonas sp. PSB1]